MESIVITKLIEHFGVAVIFAIVAVTYSVIKSRKKVGK